MASTRRTALMVLALLSSVHISQAADPQESYRISPGDTVEISIATVPEGTQRVQVQMDGTVVLRQAGPIAVAGLTPAELQTRMQAVLPAKIFRLRLADGRSQTITINPDDVTAVVAEYRPIYITGDVLTPGQQAFRPQMTVRQAAAVAGGFSLLRSRANSAGPDPVDLQRDYDSLWTDYTRDYFRGVRLRAELQDEETFDMTPPDGSPLPPSVAQAVAQSEADALKIALGDVDQERAHIEKGIKDAAAQIEILTKREQDESDSAKADEDELARLTKLFKAGNITNERLSDVRRALLLSSSRALETSVELMRMKRQQDEYSRQLERAANQRKVTLLNALNETNVRLADLAVRLRAAGQKMHPGTASNQPLQVAGETTVVRVTIMRKFGDEWRRLIADEDTEVAPGDTIEVRFGADLKTAGVQ